MLAQEALVALRTVNGYQTPPGWQGFISDTIMRELGIQLVDGRMPGFAAILGPAPTTEIAVQHRPRAAEAEHPDLPLRQPRRQDDARADGRGGRASRTTPP